MRPLIFVSLQLELAEAKGVPVRFVSVAFLEIVALAVSESAHIAQSVIALSPMSVAIIKRATASTLPNSSAVAWAANA